MKVERLQTVKDYPLPRNGWRGGFMIQRQITVVAERIKAQQRRVTSGITVALLRETGKVLDERPGTNQKWGA